MINRVCKNCGCPLFDDEDQCPDCGTPSIQHKVKQPHIKTQTKPSICKRIAECFVRWFKE